MYILRRLALAAAVAVTSLAALPSVGFAMECRYLCYGFYPPTSIIAGDVFERDRCQRRIDDSGGFCTIHGRLNLEKALPRGLFYRRGDYIDPRQYDYDVYGIRP